MGKNNEKKRVRGLIPFSLGNFSKSCVYLVTSYVSYALTESFGMSAVIVGTILMVSKIFDGTTDVIAGFIVDHTNTKWGKARPYELCYIPLWLVTILLFSMPGNLSSVGKVIWVFLTYNMSQSVFYTLTSVIESVRLKRSFDSDARVKAISVSSVITTLASIVVGAALPMLIAVFEHQEHGWTIVVSIFAIPCMIAGMLRFLLLKEMDTDEIVEQKEKVSFIDSVRVLLQNKYCWMTAGAYMMVAVNTYINTSASTYYFTHVYGNLAAASIPGLIGSLALFAIVLFGKVLNKFGSRRTMLMAFAIMGISSLMKFLAPVNLVWLVICGAAANLGLAFLQAMRNEMLIECMAYGEWKTKNRLEGIYASVDGMADKIGMGIGSLLLGVLLQIGGYDGTLDVQPESALASIKFIYIVVPFIICLIGFLFMKGFKLTEQLPSINKELEERHAHEKAGI